ncbi:MAG: F-type H+-transporting ATPase subunit epsilon [Solirubrobacteraceae bacterium]|nr:F-type H+-transporting ATPase subunit epsilon [Solirubrobacteraceae bacterium]
MARTKFQVEVLTPEGEVFNEEVEMVSTRTTVGSIGILAHHSPILATLEPTELRLYRSDSEIVRFAQAEGYLQMAENRALVLVEEAIDPGGLDRAALEQRLEQVRGEVEAAPDGSEERARAERDVRRAEAFLTIAGS